MLWLSLMNHYSLPHEVVQYKNLAGVHSSNIVPRMVIEAKPVRSGWHNNHDSYDIFFLYLINTHTEYKTKVKYAYTYAH
jgi:hypothetical protein